MRNLSLPYLLLMLSFSANATHNTKVLPNDAEEQSRNTVPASIVKERPKPKQKPAPKPPAPKPKPKPAPRQVQEVVIKPLKSTKGSNCYKHINVTGYHRDGSLLSLWHWFTDAHFESKLYLDHVKFIIALEENLSEIVYYYGGSFIANESLIGIKKRMSSSNVLCNN